ncbi:MAG TPA: trimeric intracellular cation channel family protein [Candidatus Eremiobacteraceae bacterium]|nr:trimeric intracellular cation channel family protein [Candidatus Eremiobacteraceae bacterium]
MQSSALENVINIITIAGLAAFTVSGVIVAKRKDMDAFGCMSVAFITALGGGTLRDVLLGRFPLFWIAHEWYAIGVLIFAAILFYSSRFIALRERAILIPDAFGLGLFSVTGATYALEAHTSYIVASILGVITGVFGGVLRDVICNEIPIVFSRTQLYATCALAGVWTYIILDHFGVESAWSLSLGVAVTFLTRMAAVFFDLRLPTELET